MTQVSRDVLKSYFETGDTPSADQFWELIDSLLNLKDEGVAGVCERISEEARPQWLVTEQALVRYLEQSWVGCVAPFAVDTAPAGWLACDGRAIDLTATDNSPYYRLFERIGTAFGSGNGNGQSFNLPDLRGEFVRGWENHPDGHHPTRNFGSKQEDQLQSHRHEDQGHYHYDRGHQHSNTHMRWYAHNALWVGGPGAFEPWGNESTGVGYAALDMGYAQLGEPTQSRHGTETRPRNIALLYCIKY
ncbi:MAG TPA: hypothetical protein DCR93_37120 [Cytophagales bacterium]|nr:hypothetical protein [Cytophagales bacterium]